MNKQVHARQFKTAEVLPFAAVFAEESAGPRQKVFVEMYECGDGYELALGLLQQFLREQTGAEEFLVSETVSAPLFELLPLPHDAHFSDKICPTELRQVMKECGIRYVKSLGVIATA